MIPAIKQKILLNFILKLSCLHLQTRNRVFTYCISKKYFNNLDLYNNMKKLEQFRNMAYLLNRNIEYIDINKS